VTITAKTRMTMTKATNLVEWLKIFDGGGSL
jgi:hypothetical protein